VTQRLIIADDSADMRWLVRSTLQPEFRDVIEIADGRQLFACLLRATLAAGPRSPDDLVLVVDVRMPVYSGLEVLDAWHDAEHPIPIVVITSFPDDAVRTEVERLGAVLLPKPFSRATLQRVVGDVARRARS
jgi:CheY-like chemotaxis protein